METIGKNLPSGVKYLRTKDGVNLYAYTSRKRKGMANDAEIETIYAKGFEMAKARECDTITVSIKVHKITNFVLGTKFRLLVTFSFEGESFSERVNAYFPFHKTLN